MNIDSRIMLAAVDRLIAQGIHCIPIYDSILVQAQYEGEGVTPSTSAGIPKIPRQPSVE
jgi:hypothetical protein